MEIKMDTENLAKKRITGSPLSIQILSTRDCNLNCMYCGANHIKQKEIEQELSKREWSILLNRLKEIGVFDITFSGGEIFLRKDIFEILGTAVNCKFPKIRLTTNGTLITDAASKKLSSLKIKHVEISLDGDRDANDQIRGAGSFNNTLKGLRNLVENDIVPIIRFTPIKINYKSLRSLVKILHSLGIKVLTFNTLHSTGKCSKIYKDIMLDHFFDIVEFKDILADIKKNHPGFELLYTDTSYQDFPVRYNKIRSVKNDSGGQKLKPCSAAHSSCAITSGGWVIPCSEFFDFRGGNIREQDILDIWKKSENFEKIRNLSNISTGQIPYCRNCEYNIFCSAGCRADAYAVYMDLSAPDPFCPYWKEK